MNASREKYWRRARTLTLILLAIWLLTTISVVAFARQLATVSLWGWPLHYYFASQGATLVYLAIVGVYAWVMQRLDAAVNSESHDER
jgi:putative solute:sodium symporter small subunit